MKKLIVTSLLAVGLAMLALAAEKYFVTVDTVGMCSVILDIPGTELSAGKTSIGAAEGYDTMEDAKAALAEIKEEKCEGVVVG